jgi:hypothetical protein
LPPVAPLPESLKVLVGPLVNDVILSPSIVVPEDKEVPAVAVPPVPGVLERSCP